MRFLSPLAAALAALAAGCSGEPYGDVAGTVTLDGQPLPNGMVMFTPIDGKAHTASATITTDGRFVARVPVARHRVWISSAKPLPPGADPNRVPAEERVPDRYNTRSSLEVNVEQGRNDMPLDLRTARR